MTTALVVFLAAHVLLGVLAIGFVHVVFMHLLRKEPSWPYLSGLSGWAAIGFIASWACGAYYYVTYYGKAVKPTIVSGNYPWAHAVFMEAKEHIFLMIPFLTIAVWLSIHALEKTNDQKLKNAAALLAFVTLAFGVFVAVSGIVVSGGVR